MRPAEKGVPLEGVTNKKRTFGDDSLDVRFFDGVRYCLIQKNMA